MLFTDLLELYKEWCDTYSGFSGNKTIWDYNNPPRPARPYISLQINSITQFGFNEVRGPDNGGIAKIIAQSRLVLRVNAFGSNDLVGFDAIEALENLKLSVSTFEFAKLFNETVAFMAVLSESNLTQILNTGFEGRASMDTSWLMATEMDDDVGLIEHVIAQGTVIDYNNDITHTINIEEP
jgi:hypothetical protein